MTTIKEMAENELRQLLYKARRSFVDDVDNCIDWIDEELRKAKKSIEQIEKIQHQIPEIDSKLFNDSRDCCQELKNWLKRLEDQRNILLDNEQTKLMQTLDEMSSVHDGFRRSRNLLCTK